MENLKNKVRIAEERLEDHLARYNEFLLKSEKEAEAGGDAFELMNYVLGIWGLEATKFARELEVLYLEMRIISESTIIDYCKKNFDIDLNYTLFVQGRITEELTEEQYDMLSNSEELNIMKNMMKNHIDAKDRHVELPAKISECLKLIEYMKGLDNLDKI